MTDPVAGQADAEADMRAAIEVHARELGFDAVGFAGAEADPRDAAGLAAFLEGNVYGDMGWMARDPDRRSSPHGLWPEAKTVIALGMSYAPKGDPLAGLVQHSTGNIAAYAKGRDYHDVMKKRLKVLGRWMVESYGGEIKLFVDTAPVMEKPIGARAGIGWQGKHTNLVSRTHGSWLFLGEIYTTHTLSPDQAGVDLCGSCHACQDICPTAAFPAPYRLDARRCISYLTIEHQGHIPVEFRIPIGNRIYGCDDCLAVCPWNKFAATGGEMAFHARDELISPHLAGLTQLDDAAFRALFTKSPVKRLGRDRFIRNVLIAIGNSDDLELAASAEARLGDESPLVRAMAVWALGQLLDSSAFGILKQRFLTAEADPDVRAEWAYSQP